MEHAHNRHKVLKKSRKRHKRPSELEANHAEIIVYAARQAVAMIKHYQQEGHMWDGKIIYDKHEKGKKQTYKERYRDVEPLTRTGPANKFRNDLCVEVEGINRIG